MSFLLPIINEIILTKMTILFIFQFRDGDFYVRNKVRIFLVPIWFAGKFRMPKNFYFLFIVLDPNRYSKRVSEAMPSDGVIDFWLYNFDKFCNTGLF